MLSPPAGPEPATASRPLPPGIDLLAALAALRRAGGAPWLLERANGPSLLIAGGAVEIEGRGRAVAVRALADDGRALLERARRSLAAWLEEDGGDEATFRFPRVEAHDAAERLAAPSPLHVLRALGLQLPGPHRPFPPFCLGMLGFDGVDALEDLPTNARDPLGMPDLLFRAPAAFLVRDGGKAHAVGCAWDGDGELAAARAQALADAVADAPPVPVPPPAPVPDPAVDLDHDAFSALVVRAKAYVAAGDVFQIVPSREFRAPCRDPLAAFAALRARNPSPAQFWLEMAGAVLFGASPETAVRVGHGADGLEVEVKPIAGTRPRGATPEEDRALEAELRADGKEVAEHVMLVDLGRNDVARVSVAGTRRVSALMTVERYAHVMHLVSTVTGRLRPDLDALHALAAGMNVGTLSGAPKLRATELLRGLERDKRGHYGGAVGWIAADGRTDTAVLIRAALVRDGVARVRAGAGVVADSDPGAEAEETRAKAASVLAAVAAAEAAL